MTNRHPRVQGCAVSILRGNVQGAIDEAGRRYRSKFGTAPTHVSLPKDIEPAGLTLWTLNLGCQTGPGMVMVGRVIGFGAVHLTEHPSLPTLVRSLAAF
jgi:hypothetical protein